MSEFVTVAVADSQDAGQALFDINIGAMFSLTETEARTLMALLVEWGYPDILDGIAVIDAATSEVEGYCDLCALPADQHRQVQKVDEDGNDYETLECPTVVHIPA
jgi:hypothetical protein